jgi:hypothetical protein
MAHRRMTGSAAHSTGDPRDVRHHQRSVLLTVSHPVSRRSCHSRATSPESKAITPGHGVLTASFATRGSRVQIPSAPLNALVRAISARPRVAFGPRSVMRRATDAPQGPPRAPRSLGGAFSPCLRSVGPPPSRFLSHSTCRAPRLIHRGPPVPGPRGAGRGLGMPTRTRD